jgi:hypothetical protein
MEDRVVSHAGGGKRREERKRKKKKIEASYKYK